ncbi:MAG: thioesterase family protein [Cyclobacteriaceae bacterium]|nr:thioesterase family protein [Cyclobacteriaceae bacterium]
MICFETNIRVRYAETDQMGYVYYGNYATYYEVARVEFLRSLGFSYKLLETQGVMMPVLENKSKFIRPARYDDLLTIKVKLNKIPVNRMTFEYAIYNEHNKLINIGETVLAFVDMKSGKPCDAPESILSLLEPLFNVK